MPGRDAPYSRMRCDGCCGLPASRWSGPPAIPVPSGGRTLANLAGFPGACTASIRTRPTSAGTPASRMWPIFRETVDCVVVAVPAAGTEAVVRQCAAAGVGGVIVLASGYAETGTVGTGGQRACGNWPRRRTCGWSDRTAWAWPAWAMASMVPSPSFRTRDRAGLPRVGLVSRSGALGLAPCRAADRGISFSHVRRAGTPAMSMSPTSSPTWPKHPIAMRSHWPTKAWGSWTAAAGHPAGHATGQARGLVPVTSVAGRDAIRHHTATGDGGVGAAGEAGGLVCRSPRDRGTGRYRSLPNKGASPRAGGVGAQWLRWHRHPGGRRRRAGRGADAANRVRHRGSVCRGLARVRVAPQPCDATAQATRNPESMLAVPRPCSPTPGFAALVIPGAAPDLTAAARHRRTGSSPRQAGVRRMSQSLQTETTLATERTPALAQFRSPGPLLPARWLHGDGATRWDPAPTPRS